MVNALPVRTQLVGLHRTVNHGDIFNMFKKVDGQLQSSLQSAMDVLAWRDAPLQHVGIVSVGSSNLIKAT